MPHTKKNLQSVHHLTADEVNFTLVACGLPIDKKEYTEEEIQLGFSAIRSYFTDGLASDYQQAAELFEQAKQRELEVNTNSETESENKLINKCLSMSELLAYAAQQIGARVTLAETIKALQLCGLPEKDDYSLQECDRFLEICILMKQQGKPQNLDDRLSDTAAESEQKLANVVDRVTKARAKNIPSLVNEMYLKNVVEELANNQENIESFYTGLEERILNKIEGKSPWGSMRATNWETVSLPPSLEKPMLLPPESEPTTNDDS